MITKRIDSVTRIPEAYRVPRPPAPRSVKIEITGRCNYRCSFCALRMRESQPTADMDPALFRKITTEMRQAGVEEIGVFYLGESFMAPSLLVDCVSFLKRDLAFPYVFLTSNGAMAYPEVVGRCMDAGLDSLKWSVNAADAEQFERVTGVKRQSFERALQNIRSACEIRGTRKTGLYASSILYDADQRAKMEPLLAERVRPYVDEHYWLPLYSMGSLATQRELELGYRPTAGNQGRLDAMREPLPCWAAFTEGHVTSDGKLSACCFDADARWTMGDLNKQSFMDAWHSDTFAALRDAHLKRDVTGTPCEKCVAYSD